MNSFEKKELTKREVEVLELVTQGLTNNQIAEKLLITNHTAKAHIASILRKLNAKNRTQAVSIYNQNIFKGIEISSK